MRTDCWAIIFPQLTSYNLSLLYGLAVSRNLLVFFSDGPADSGFGNALPFEHPNVTWVKVPTVKPFGPKLGLFQLGIPYYLIRHRPTVIVFSVSFRYLSFWTGLIASRILKLEIFARGHGLIHKKNISNLQKYLYKLTFLLCDRYICYTPSVKESLLPLINPDRLAVDFNALTNDYPVHYDEKTGSETDIFFIGRLRENCMVELLISATDRVRAEINKDINLHIIGDGDRSEAVEEWTGRFSWVNYYGMVFDQKKISEISRKSLFGCYPGDMGLSVVHMMSLSLPPLTHGDMHVHQGPEPSYILDNANGWFYAPRGNLDALARKIIAVYSLDQHAIRQAQQSAYQTYLQLSNPPHHVRFERIIQAAVGG